MLPTIGRIVHYKLNEADRSELGNYQKHQKVNNPSDVLPAIIVAVWGPACINLQVFVDGQTGFIWKTSINQGDSEGQWNWAPLVK